MFLQGSLIYNFETLFMANYGLDFLQARARTNEEKESGRRLFYFHNVKGGAVISTLINYYCFCSLRPDRLRHTQMRRMSWDNS